MHIRSLALPVSRAFAAALAILMSAGAASATSIVNFSITTAGCFNCSATGPFTDPAAYGSYTFDGVTASPEVSDATGGTVVDLGAFSRDNSNYTDFPTGNDFVLEVTFVVPVGVGSSSFTAFIIGAQGNPGTFDFNNSFQVYNFTNVLGSGSFEFRVNDITSINKNTSGNLLTGDIRNATFTGVNDPPPTSAVPEPGSLFLLGAGLLLTAAQARKRLRRR